MEGSDYEDKYSQQADDMGRMSNHKKRKDKSERKRIGVNHNSLMKGVILCPTRKSITAKRVATLFFHKVYLHFRLYNKIIADWGPQFTSTFTKELWRLLNYNLSLSTTYHP